MPRKSRRTTRAAAPLTKIAELSIAAPQVIALRSLMLLSSGSTARSNAETVRMVAEKGRAWQESMLSMAVQAQRAQQAYAATAMRQWWSLWAAPWRALGTPLAAPGLPTPAQMQRAGLRLLDSGLAPVHRRATANAKRLSRRKR